MTLFNWFYANAKCVIIVVGTAFLAVDAVLFLHKKYVKSCKKGRENSNLNKPIYEVMFFSEQGTLCRNHGHANIPCHLASCPISYLNKINEYLSSATRTVDVCVYFLTLSTVIKTIIDLKRRGIIIRVITDDETSGNDSSQVYNMRKAGLPIRSRTSEYLMHHKFAIVDRKLLITGSANWTAQAFFGNSENVVVTNQVDLVNAFVNEFEKLWLKYCPDGTTIQ